MVQDGRASMAESQGSGSTTRRAVLVLGMHRSGTSAIGGVLDALGLEAPKTPLPANDFNMRGYWESAPLIKLHERLLNSADSSWDDWRPLDLQASRVAEPYRPAIEAVIADEFGDAPLIFIKDPESAGLFRSSRRSWPE